MSRARFFAMPVIDATMDTIIDTSSIREKNNTYFIEWIRKYV